MKQNKHRPNGPVSSALDVVGDKWSLVIIWDMLIAGKNTYNELLKSNSGIATNILANRLGSLEAAGIITKEEHPDSKAKILYRLTHKGISLLPVLVELILWADAWQPAHAPGGEYLKILKQNKEAFVKQVMEDARKKVAG